MSIDERELRELYERYAHLVYLRCLSILKDEQDARDAVQETFARVMRSSDGFRRQASPMTWMYRISTNHCLNLIRDRKGRAEKLAARPDEVAPAPLPALEVALRDQETLRRLLDQVDEETRRVVIHTYFDDCTREEVAELVGISVPTVRKRVQTFLESARRALGVAAAAALAILPWSTP